MHGLEANTDEEELLLTRRLSSVLNVTRTLNANYRRQLLSSNNNAIHNTTTTNSSSLSYDQQQRQQQHRPLLSGDYAAWQWYDRDSLSSPTNLQLHKYSRINYAFFQPDSDGYIFGMDSWADPNILFGPYEFDAVSNELPDGCRGGLGRDDGKGTIASSSSEVEEDEPCLYFEQCHRNYPNSKSCNIRKYKEGLIYLAHVAGAEVYVSIGGWTLSGSFPTVAAIQRKRALFAEECVGLIRDYGFDGINIDWEYPGYAPHGGTPADSFNFIKLLVDVREALNTYQSQTGDAPLAGGPFGLTAHLPCEPSNIDFLDLPSLSAVLDGMNLMSFDFHDARMGNVTGVNSPLFDQEWDDVEGLSVDGCVTNYLEAVAGEEEVARKIRIGVPFYGKTFSYATEINGYHSNTNGQSGGNVDQQNWPRDFGTPNYYRIVDKLSKGGMVSKRHEPTKTQYAYFKDGSGLVSYDDPQAVCDKANYVNTNQLGGLVVWEISGDLMENLETPLIDAINRKLEEPTFDCSSIAIITSDDDSSIFALDTNSPSTQTFSAIPTMSLTTMTPTISVSQAASVNLTTASPTASEDTATSVNAEVDDIQSSAFIRSYSMAVVVGAITIGKSLYVFMQ